MNNVENIVELVDENQNIVKFKHLMTLDYDNREYVVLVPVEDADSKPKNEEDIAILRVDQDENGIDYYATIEDEKELNDVLSAVNQVYNQGFENK